MVVVLSGQDGVGDTPSAPGLSQVEPASSLDGFATSIPIADSMLAPWPGALKCDCGEVYPMYGVAPHECYWRKGPEFVIGQSTLLPLSEWTELFVPELEDDETWADFVYPGACGIFYCGKCQQDRYTKAWVALVARVGEPPEDAHAQGMSAGTAETQSGSGLQPASPVAESDAP